MSDLSPFAGLVRQHVGEALSEEFLYRNQTIIDRLLQIGAITHHHDGHAALAGPADAPTAVVSPVGGTIPADTPISLTYTWVDDQGGETAPAPVLVVSTDPGLSAPDDGPTAVVDNAAGTLLADTYYYALTVVDGMGGETALGPAVEVTVDPGNANSEIALSGLTAILTAVGGTEWRMWRAVGSGTWQMLNQGSGDTMTDDGSFCADSSVQPPETGTTGSTSRLTVQVPGPAPADAVNFNLYLSTDGSFADPSLVATHPVADVATDIAVNSLTTVAGSPPPVSLAVGGASKIDPDTEVLGVFKRPVANLAALPSVGNSDGDIRETLDDHALHAWNDTAGAWQALAGGGGGGGSLSNPMDTYVEWTDANGDVRARVYAHLRTDEVIVPGTDYYGISGHADEDPANGNLGYQTLTNEVKPSTATDRSTLDTDGVWSTATLVYGKANRDCHILSAANIARLGIGFGDVTAHVGIFAWILAGATWKLQIVARTDGTGYGAASEAGFTVIAEDDLPTPADGDYFWLTFEQKPGNLVSATVGQGKATVGDIPDTPIPAGAIRDAFGDAGTVTKALMTADRWLTNAAWETGNIEMYNVSVHPEIWADVLPEGSSSWAQRRIASDAAYGDTLASQINYETGVDSYGDHPTDIPAIYSDDPNDGVVRMGGKVARTGAGAVGTSETIGQITATSPHGRPNRATALPVVIGDDNGQGMGLLFIGTDGTLTITPVYVWTVGANPWVSLDAVIYRLYG